MKKITFNVSSGQYGDIRTPKESIVFGLITYKDNWIFNDNTPICHISALISIS